VRNCYELGECQSPEERVVLHLEVSYLELQMLSTEVFLSPESHEKSDLADGSRYCSGDYSMERCPFGT
jgi:hypothetical protein